MLLGRDVSPVLPAILIFQEELEIKVFVWNLLIINIKDCLEPIQILKKNPCSVQAKHVCRLLSAFGSAVCHLCSLDPLFPALIPWVITLMLSCHHHFLMRNKLSFLENWKIREFECENIQVASHDSPLACVLFSSPCAMKMEKRMLGPNLHLIFYDVLPAPGPYPVLMHMCVKTEWLPFWHQSLDCST